VYPFIQLKVNGVEIRTSILFSPSNRLKSQKHPMDQKAVARDFGNKLTFLAGIDVQQAL